MKHTVLGLVTWPARRVCALCTLLRVPRAAVHPNVQRSSYPHTIIPTITPTATTTTGSAQPTKKKKQSAISALDPKFYGTILRLARIAIPTWKSKGSMLFVAQFFLLVMRTLLTVTAVKANIYFLTKVNLLI
jgi:hypothetical protein